MTSPNFLYLHLASRFERMIEDDVLKVGDKLPSVRSLSKEQGVSMSTAYQAYVELEKKGLIEARPKSGYYVRFSPKHARKTPNAAVPFVKEAVQDVEEMIKQVYGNLTHQDIIPFSVNMPAAELLPTAKLKKSVTEVLRKFPTESLLYGEVEGSFRLRTQIARLAFNAGLAVSADEIIVSAGCIEAVKLALIALTKPGDVVAVESPTFFGITKTITELNRKVLEVPTHPETGVELEVLNQWIPEKKIRACVFVTNFSNPLGAIIPDEQKKRLVEIVDRHEVILIENDIYGELYFDTKRPMACKSFDVNDSVVLCSSVSKNLAPGYRVGWLIPGKHYEKVNKSLNHQTVSSLGQEVIAHFLEHSRYELHMRSLRKALHTQCLKYLQVIHDYFPDYVKVSQPRGGFVLWLELVDGVDTFEIFKRAIQEYISIAPGQLFSRQANYSHFLRISFGMPFTKKVEQALKRLGTIVHEVGMRQ
ncbi:MAG: PLP-dependent aminotransferase family protein [Flammeovirgaceae bacterium]